MLGVAESGVTASAPPTAPFGYSHSRHCQGEQSQAGNGENTGVVAVGLANLVAVEPVHDDHPLEHATSRCLEHHRRTQ